MRRCETRQQATEEVTGIICNRCGKEISVKNGRKTEGVFSVDFQWEYPAEKDCERHSFDLCESCYDEITAAFKVPVEKK